MDIALAKALVTACFDAKEVVDMMPALPDGVTPLAIRIIDTIEHLTRVKGYAHPRDVAKERKLAMPSVTRSVKALEKIGAVKKESDPKDRRFIMLSLTPLGKQWYDTYVHDFYDHYAKKLCEINEADAMVMMDVINHMNHTMKNMMEEDVYGRH